jgi:hypothetical protein
VTEISPADPDLPRQRRTITGGLVFSAAVITFVLFSLGDLPQIDALFSGLDTTLRNRNDIIVRDILALAPYALVIGSVFSLTYMILGHFNRHRPPASPSGKQSTHY